MALEVTVFFTYAGQRCKARFTERDAARSLAQVRRLLTMVKAETPGETPALFGCCPSCGAAGQFEYAGAQVCDDRAPDLELWNCAGCHSTLTTRSIMRASVKGGGDGA